MQEKHLFEYAVIRIVPRVEREEFLNVGVILYCQRLQFLQTLFRLHKERLHVFSDAIDVEEVDAYLQAFVRICKADVDVGPIGKLEIAARFRWLTATRSTVVQISKVHPGFCVDAGEALQRLYAQLVL